jgi:hypothetical protein
MCDYFINSDKKIKDQEEGYHVWNDNVSLGTVVLISLLYKLLMMMMMMTTTIMKKKKILTMMTTMMMMDQSGAQTE